MQKERSLGTWGSFKVLLTCLKLIHPYLLLVVSRLRHDFTISVSIGTL